MKLNLKLVITVLLSQAFFSLNAFSQDNSAQLSTCSVDSSSLYQLSNYDLVHYPEKESEKETITIPMTLTVELGGSFSGNGDRVTKEIDRNIDKLFGRGSSNLASVVDARDSLVKDKVFYDDSTFEWPNSKSDNPGSRPEINVISVTKKDNTDKDIAYAEPELVARYTSDDGTKVSYAIKFPSIGWDAPNSKIPKSNYTAVINLEVSYQVNAQDPAPVKIGEVLFDANSSAFSVDLETGYAFNENTKIKGLAIIGSDDEECYVYGDLEADSSAEKENVVFKSNYTFNNFTLDSSTKALVLSGTEDGNLQIDIKK